MTDWLQYRADAPVINDTAVVRAAKAFNKVLVGGDDWDTMDPSHRTEYLFAAREALCAARLDREPK